MDLFSGELITNMLPYDGQVNYFGRVISAGQASDYRDQLLTDIAWKNDEAKIFGRHIITKRKVAWYADHHYAYTYSGTTRMALPWTKALSELKALVESLSGNVYNACLLNLYHNGQEGMAWHSDDEKSLAKDSAIASLSFGAERKFSLKHKATQYSTSVILEHGSLLVMKGDTQTHWLHALPKSSKVSKPRINLTFRTMV